MLGLADLVIRRLGKTKSFFGFGKNKSGQTRLHSYVHVLLSKPLVRFAEPDRTHRSMNRTRRLRHLLNYLLSRVCI